VIIAALGLAVARQVWVHGELPGHSPRLNQARRNHPAIPRRGSGCPRSRCLTAVLRARDPLPLSRRGALVAANRVRA
jgi:hypothetical protein